MKKIGGFFFQALHYGGTGTVTGPTVAGCSVDSTSHTVVVRFNKTLLKGDAVVITRVQTPIPLGADVAEVAAPNLKPPVTKPPTPVGQSLSLSLSLSLSHWLSIFMHIYLSLYTCGICQPRRAPRCPVVQKPTYVQLFYTHTHSLTLSLYLATTGAAHRTGDGLFAHARVYWGRCGLRLLVVEEPRSHAGPVRGQLRHYLFLDHYFGTLFRTKLAALVRTHPRLCDSTPCDVHCTLASFNLT